MKRLAVHAAMIAFGVGLCVGHAGAQDTAKAPKNAASRQVSGGFLATLYDNLWAVVIGINKYKHWDRLEYAVNDARAVKSMLIGTFGFKPSNIIELLDNDASLVNIRTTLGGVLPSKTKRNDGVFVFFAGHGETVDLPDGGNLGYLVPCEGSTQRSEYFATLLPMTQIREICSLIPAKHIFFVVDACYSGLAASSERGGNRDRGISVETKMYITKLAGLKSRQILTAGGRGEPVVEKAEWGHSAFTYKLLEGMQSSLADADGDGILTAGEIATYIKSRVPRISNNRQTPQFKNLSNDEGEFIFVPTALLRKEAPDVTPPATAAQPQDQDVLRRELERLKIENEKLRQQQDTKKTSAPEREEKKKNDDVYAPPP